jgi:hypothetical protein
MWSPEYEFVLLPIQLDAFEVLSSHYRDAVEEIKALKETQALFSSAVLSLSSKSAFNGGALVPWNGDQPRIVPSSHYKISQDSTQITFLFRGLYQINCRLAATFNACDSSRDRYSQSPCEQQKHHFALKINGKQIASVVQSNVVNQVGGTATAHMTEVEEIAAESVLTIEASGLLGAEEQNRLSIVLLHAL